MKHTVSRRTLSFLLAMALVVSLFAGLTMTASAANLTGTPTGYTKASDVVYDTSGTYLKNWGARGENCTFLTTYAQNYYTGSYSYETLSANAGGTSQSNATSSALYTALQNMQRLWNGSVNLDPVAIGEGLIPLGLPHEVLTDKGITVFIAPYVCGACVDEQCEALTGLLGSDAAGVPIRFLTPQFKAKDLKAIFATYPSVKIQTYDYDLLQDPALRDLNDVLYFATTDKGFRHVMLSVKGMPELTAEYVNLIKNQCL